MFRCKALSIIVLSLAAIVADAHFTAARADDDPTKVRELARYAKDGEWSVEGARASATNKLLPARKVFLKKIGERWYLEDRDK